MRTTIKWRDAEKFQPTKSGSHFCLIDGNLEVSRYDDISGDWDQMGITHFALPSDITTEEEA